MSEARRGRVHHSKPHYGDDPRVTASNMRQVNRQAMQDTMIQFVGDCMLEMLHDEFGFGPDRLLRANIALDASLLKWGDILKQPKRGDLADETGYLRSKFDEKQAEICGKYFKHPFQERYPWIEDGII